MPAGGNGASDPGFWGISRDVPGIEKRFWCPPNSDLISLQVASPRINFRTKEVTGPFPSNPADQRARDHRGLEGGDSMICSLKAGATKNLGP